MKLDVRSKVKSIFQNGGIPQNYLTDQEMRIYRMIPYLVFKHNFRAESNSENGCNSQLLDTAEDAVSLGTADDENLQILDSANADSQNLHSADEDDLQYIEDESQYIDEEAEESYNNQEQESSTASVTANNIVPRKVSHSTSKGDRTTPNVGLKNTDHLPSTRIQKETAETTKVSQKL